MAITIRAYSPAMRSSTTIPAPPRSCWLARAGNGLVTSKIRNRTKPTASTASVGGNGRTASVIPAISSMTIAPGSLPPSTRSARCAAHVPASVTTTKKITSPAGAKGTSQMIRATKRLPTVPGATGA